MYLLHTSCALGFSQKMYLFLVLVSVPLLLVFTVICGGLLRKVGVSLFQDLRSAIQVSVLVSYTRLESYLEL